MRPTGVFWVLFAGVGMILLSCTQSAKPAVTNNATETVEQNQSVSEAAKIVPSQENKGVKTDAAVAKVETAVPVVATPMVKNKPRIFIVHSYHEEMEWIHEINNGIAAALSKRLEQGNLETKYFYMDTKNKPTEEWKVSIAQQAAEAIKAFDPEVIIAADDNATNYVAAHHFANTKYQCVFLGVNANPQKYGLPAANVTGFVEHENFVQTANLLKQIDPRLERVVFLADASESTEGLEERVNSNLQLIDLEVSLVKRTADYATWKQIIQEYQQPGNCFVFGHYHTVQENGKTVPAPEVLDWILSNSHVPEGSFWAFAINQGVLGAITVSGYQHGYQAGMRALEILDIGKKAGEYPIKRITEGEQMLNGARAQELHIAIPPELLKNSVIVQKMTSRESTGEKKADKQAHRIFIVHSYHEEYEWIQAINSGIATVLRKRIGADIETKYFYMDTKRQTSEEWKLKIAQKAMEEIKAFNTQIVIASDDNAAKYVIAPLIDTPYQCVYLGVNADPATYGFPASNVTGFNERENFLQTINLLKEICPAVEKVVVLADASETSLGLAERIQKSQDAIPLELAAIKRVETFEDWKKAVLECQSASDCLLLGTYHTLKDETPGPSVPAVKVMEWTLRNSKIPEGVLWGFAINEGALCGITVSGYEHGYQAAKRALNIIDTGKKAGEFPIEDINKGLQMINTARARQVGIKIPDEILKNSELVNKQNAIEE